MTQVIWKLVLCELLNIRKKVQNSEGNFPTLGMIVKEFNFSQKTQMVRNWEFWGGVLLTPLMGSRDNTPGGLSYTALPQTLQSLCQQERQALNIIKTLK